MAGPLQIVLLRTPSWILRFGWAVVLWLVLSRLRLIVAGPVLWILGSLYVSLTQIVVEELQEEHQARRCLKMEVEGYGFVLAERDARIVKLEADLIAARPSTRSRQEPDVHPVYRRVGLSPAAPDWLIQAARTAYRRRLHPDVHPAQHRQQAHDRYIRAEEAFERISQLRRQSSNP